MVSAMEGQKRAKEIEAHAFHEISVRESVDQVMIRNVLDQFDKVKNKIRRIKKQVSLLS